MTLGLRSFVIVFFVFSYGSSLNASPNEILALQPSPYVKFQNTDINLHSIVLENNGASVRMWHIDGRSYLDGEQLSLTPGKHTASYWVTGLRGGHESRRFDFEVGAEPAEDPNRFSAPSHPAPSFSWDSKDTLRIKNVGTTAISNPRLIPQSGLDTIDWRRIIATVPGRPPSFYWQDHTLFSLWTLYGEKLISHFCSPGRLNEFIIDPAQLLRGYGYGCCSHKSRALAYLAAYLGIPSRVATTPRHEFPEVFLSGRWLVLDPDEGLTFWSSKTGFPLASTSPDHAVETLANSPDFFMVNVNGNKLIPGLPPAENASWYKEKYSANQSEKVRWGYIAAYSNVGFKLNPGESIEFNRQSTIPPIQPLDPETGKPISTDPMNDTVGTVRLRQIWSSVGPRNLRSDGKMTILPAPRNLPYPLRGFVVYFDKVPNQDSLFITVGGQQLKIGNLQANVWSVDSSLLDRLPDLTGMEVHFDGDAPLVSIDWLMQFNPKIFESADQSVKVTYADDSGDCQRAIQVNDTIHEFGDVPCPVIPKFSNRQDLDFTPKGNGFASILSLSGGYYGIWGIDAKAGAKTTINIAIPRIPGAHASVRASINGNPFDWSFHDGNAWVSITPNDMNNYQSFILPPTKSGHTHLRAQLRRPILSDGVATLSFLSIEEGPQNVFFDATNR